MKTLQAFMQPIKEETMEVIVSDRFKDEDGNSIPFVVRPITQDENTTLMQKYTKKR